MSYEKVDTPRLNGTNMFLVYVHEGSVHTHKEPTITTHTGIQSCTINGADEYTDTNTGLTVKALVSSGSLVFYYSYKEPDDGPKTGSSIASITISSIGDTEYNSASFTYTIGIVCCMVPLSIGIVSTHDIPVSGLAKTIDLYPAKFIEDVYDGSTSDVIFSNNLGVLEGVPDSPGAYIGKVSDTFEPIKGIVSHIIRPANIAIKDTRVYTDQEYVLVVDDPTTVTVDRSAVKIHNLSDGSENIPFSENPGNGFYLSCPTSSSSPGTVTYTDDAGDVHTYDIDRVYPGYDNLEDAEHNCQYFIDGSCTYDKSVCAHTLGIRRPTDSSWGLYHNGIAVDNVDTVYNSEYPPSFGWAKSTITGEAEIQYNGVPYTYLASYDSLTYKPEKGSCVELEPHRLQFYGVKDSVSKALKGWGAYGGPASQPYTLSIIAYDTVTEKYAPGYRTSLIDVSDSTIIEGVSPITGAALLTHPITSSYLDNALVIGSSGVVSGYGTSSGPYGAAVPDTILPTYDWAQFYLNRPRQSSIGADTKITGSIQYNGDSRIAVKWWHKYYMRSQIDYSGFHFHVLDTRSYADDPLQCSAYKGILQSTDITDMIDIVGTVDLPDISTSLPMYKYSLDIPETFTGISSGNLKYTLNKNSIRGDRKDISVHGGLRFNRYIVFQDILYETGTAIVPIWCTEYDDLCAFSTTTDDGAEKCRRLLKTWTSVTSLEHLKGIKVEVESDSISPKIDDYGKLYLSYLTLDDLYTYEKEGYNYVEASTSVRTLYDTPSSIKAYLVLDVYRSDTGAIIDMTVDSIEYMVDYGGFGQFTINESEIKPIKESDLVKSYNVTITETIEEYTSIARTPPDQYNNKPGTYYIYCDGSDGCAAIPCSYRKEEKHIIDATRCCAIDARYGSTPYGFTPSSDATHEYTVTYSPACIEGIDVSSASNSYTYGNVAIAIRLLSPEEVVSGAFRFDTSTSSISYSNCTLYGSPVATEYSRTSRVSIDNDLSPRAAVYGSGCNSSGHRVNSVGLHAGTGYGGASYFSDTYCEYPNWSDGAGVLESFNFSWNSSFGMHTFDNDSDSDIPCSTDIRCTRNGDSFKLDITGNDPLRLYFPKPGTVTSTSTKSCIDTDAGNSKYKSGSVTVTTERTTTVTIEDADSLSDSSVGDDVVPIVCYVSGGMAIESEYKSIGKVIDNYSKIDTTTVVSSIGIHPFEAPIKTSSKYRGIAASGATHIMTDIDLSNSSNQNPEYTLAFYGDCNVDYTAPTGDNKWQFLCHSDRDYYDYSNSYDGSVSVADTLDEPTRQDINISDVHTMPIEVPLQKSIDFTVTVGPSDSVTDIFDIDFDYYELSYTHSTTLTEGTAIGLYMKSTLTIVWSSRPVFETAVNDGLSASTDIILPVIPCDDRSIYKSVYTAISQSGASSDKYETSEDCVSSSFRSVVDLCDINLQENSHENALTDISTSTSPSSCMDGLITKNTLYRMFVPEIKDPDTLRETIKRVLMDKIGETDISVPFNLFSLVNNLYDTKNPDGSDSFVEHTKDRWIKPIKDGIVIARRHNFT